MDVIAPPLDASDGDAMGWPRGPLPETVAAPAEGGNRRQPREHSVVGPALGEALDRG